MVFVCYGTENRNRNADRQAHCSFYSVGDFVEWMLPKRDAALDLPPISYTYCPRIVSEKDPNTPLSLSEEDLTIVWYI